MDTQAPVSGRKQVRAPIKEGPVELRPGEYMGRNGEVLRRTPVKAGNPFDLPDEIKEPGWSYQWIRHSVYNSTDYSELATMKRAGWREVHPDALNGYFRDETPEGQNFVTKEGLVLVERPAGMTRDAQNDALGVANLHYQKQLNKIYDETFQMPDGFKPEGSRLDREDLQAAPRDWKPAHRPRAAVAVEE
jgi:hypothetical protein